MIILEGVRKILGAGGDRRPIIAGADMQIPTDWHIALLGPSREDKNILINILAGIILPTVGHIVRNARVSFPVGYLGGFARRSSVRVNVSHVARLYGADVFVVTDFVEKIADMGSSFNDPYEKLSRKAKKEIAKILAYSIPFDTYLLGEGPGAPGKKGFKTKSYALFEARAKTSGMIIATEDPEVALKHCDMALILRRGSLRLFDDVEQALSIATRKK